MHTLEPRFTDALSEIRRDRPSAEIIFEAPHTPGVSGPPPGLLVTVNVEELVDADVLVVFGLIAKKTPTVIIAVIDTSRAAT